MNRKIGDTSTTCTRVNTTCSALFLLCTHTYSLLYFDYLYYLYLAKLCRYIMDILWINDGL